MSAYGPSPSRDGPQVVLPPKLFQLEPSNVKPKAMAASVSVHHLTSATIPPSLAKFLYTAFQDELNRGRTYPQEYPMTKDNFDTYFLGNDCFVGVLHPSQHCDYLPPNSSVESTKENRSWEECIVGTYYVKPNYPGRSSHICNAGFLVLPAFRQMGIASALARSYIENAPRLGYKASIFNLVYVNNEASVRIWDRLGFTKIGRIPKAGYLKKQGSEDEEYVDAWIVYKSFEDVSEDSPIQPLHE